MKKLVAYSSISHMGFVTLGFFIAFRILANPELTNEAAMNGAVLGMSGGIVQMISHGFISGAMFLCIGVLYRITSYNVCYTKLLREKTPCIGICWY